MIRQYAPKRKLTLVDIGCGTGKNVETFSKFGTSWGLDQSEEAIAFCKKRGLKYIKKGTAERSGFPEATFDVITALDVIEHTDDVKAMREMFRILKPDGVIIATVPAYQWLWSRWDEVLHHKRRYEKYDLEKLFQRGGCTVIKCSFLYSFLLFPVCIVRIIKSWAVPDSYGSDFRLTNTFLNTLILFLCRIESWVFRQYTIAFGTSIVCVGRKK